MKPRLLHRIDVRTKHGALAGIIAAVYRAFERSRQRHALGDLSDAQLRDIGLTRREVDIESGKPFWR
jgi:uncharacterized protein YjiS (DUF1127 family)